jgi:H+/Cl- antiporter ClcA
MGDLAAKRLQNMMELSHSQGRKLQDLSWRFLPYWVSAVATALVAVLFSRMFAFSERVAMRWGGANPYYSLFLIPFGLLACSVVIRIFAPAAGGSGIPQLIASLKALPEDYGLPSVLLSPFTVVVKIFSTCACILCGGVVGREGPMLQISGGIFHFAYRRWPRRQDIDLKSMILAGGAAGLAAAFNTPLGGIVFAIEELAKVHLSGFRTYILHAVIIAGLLAEGFLGNYLYLGHIQAADSGMQSLPSVIACALVIGGFAALLFKALLKVGTFRSRLSWPGQAVVAVSFGLVVAGLFLWAGSKGLGSGRELMIEMLQHPGDRPSLALVCARSFSNFFTYAAGVAGGVFAPSLASGAVLGSWIGQFLPGTDPQLLILVGMVAFLTGVTQTPITSCVLVLEMTDGHRVIFSLMLAALFAQGAAKAIQHESFYEVVSDQILEARLKQTEKSAPPEATPAVGNPL